MGGMGKERGKVELSTSGRGGVVSVYNNEEVTCFTAGIGHMNDGRVRVNDELDISLKGWFP